MNGDDQQLEPYQQMQQTAQQLQLPPPPPAAPVAQVQPPPPQPEPPPIAQPKPYHQVLDEYNQMTTGHPVLQDMPLPEWSDNMNKITGTNQYSEGLNDSALRRAGANLELGLRHFGAGEAPTKYTLSGLLGGPQEGWNLPELAHKGGAAAAGALGASPELSEKIGQQTEQFPFMATAIGAGLATGPAAPYTTGALFGLHTYGETGAVLPSLVSAATPKVVGAVGEWGGQQILSAMGAKTLSELSPELSNLVSKSPETAKNLAKLTAGGTGQILGEVAGKQAGMYAALQGLGTAETLTGPQTWADKLNAIRQQYTGTSLVAGAVGVLPFTLMDALAVEKNPVKAGEQAVEGQFAGEFTKEWMKDRVIPPTPQEVQEGITRAKKGQPEPPAEKDIQVDPFAMDVDKATKLAEKRMKDPVGEVLASMAQAPLVIDQKGLETPVITKEEAWPMTGPMGAMDSVRTRANDMLVARGATTNAGEGFDKGHDQNLYSIIRAVEEHGKGTYSKEDVTQIAASRMVDVWQKDKADLKVSGYRPEAEQPSYPFSKGLSAERNQTKFEEQQKVEAEITKRISPTIPSDEAVEQSKKYGGSVPTGTGRLNPDYDQDLHQKIAIVAGDEEMRREAGIPDDLYSSIWQNMQQGEAKLRKESGEEFEPVTKMGQLESRLPGNVIDLSTNLGPKMFQKIRSLEQAIQDEVAQNGFFTTNTHNEVVRSATTPGERAVPSDYNPRLEALQQQLMELEGLNKSEFAQRERGGIAPIADVTHEAYKAALNYTKPFDINKPDQVGEFVRYIKGAIRNAEADWGRVRAGEPYVRDQQGNIMTPETREGALAIARQLQQAAEKVPGDFEVRYKVPEEPEEDGKFRIIEHQFVNVFSMPDRKGLGEFGPGEVEPGEREETTERVEQRPLQDRIDTGGATLEDLQRDFFKNKFIALGRLSDPAEREARKGALAANATDFINAMKNADFAKVTTDFTGAKKISDVSELKQKFIRYIQFMRDDGYVDIVPNKTGTGLVGEGNMEAFNNYMKGAGLGYGDYPEGHKFAGKPQLHKWNQEASGANFFEKFLNFTRYMGRFMLDPRTLEVNAERRPDGDFGFYNFANREKFMDKVDVPWSTGEKVGATLKSASEKFPDLLYSRLGDPYSFKVTHNPIADMQIRSTEGDLFSRAHKVVDMYERFGNVDPQDLAVAKLLLKSPFVRNQHVGFSMTQDPVNKGYFHTSGVLDSAGILVDPYKPAPGGRVELQTPRESFKTFVEELGHSAVDFAFNTDLKYLAKDPYLQDQLQSFRQEVTDIHKFLVEHREATKNVLGSQIVTDNLAHALSDPREMLAQMMSNSDFRTWLASVPDAMDHPLPAELGFGTNMFQRLWNLVKRVFSDMLGPDSANYMLNRMTQVTTRGIQLQDRMRLFNTPDIYNFLQQEHKLDVGRLEELVGKPVPKPIEPTQTYQQFETKTPAEVGGPKGPVKLEDDYVRKGLLEEVNRAEMELSYTRFGKFTGALTTAGLAPPKGVSKQMMEKPRVSIGVGVRQAQENLDYAKRRLEIYDKYSSEGAAPQNVRWQINDIDSAMADAKAMLALAQSQPYFRGGASPSVQRYTTLIQDLQGIRDRLSQYATERLGEVLESRVNDNPQRVYDSMSNAATHTAEDMKGDTWFRPYDMAYFRRVFGPVFGDKLRLDINGNQMGYKVNNADVMALTRDDVVRMPQPIVKPWAPSLFETMRSLFKKDGSDDRTAEAQALFTLQWGALLRSSDFATFGALPSGFESAGKKYSGMAWNPGKYIGITPDVFKSVFAGPQEVIRHESAHAAGFNSRLSAEPPDIQASVLQINAMFSRMSEREREAYLQNLVNISHLDFGSANWISKYETGTPQEFAANVMGHMGDMLSNVPDPSVYFKDQLRFVPDEVSQLYRLTAWRRLQGVDRYGWQMRQAENTRGFANRLGPVVQAVNSVFQGMSRSALEIAEDISEFQRTRLVFPDSYRGLLQGLDENMAKYFSGPPGQEITAAPRIPGEALESRMPAAIEKLVRNWLPLPTSDGRIPRKLGFWDLALTQFSQFASKYPAARSFYDMLATSRAISQVNRIKMMTALAGSYAGGKVLDDVRTRHVAEFMKSPQLRDAFSKIALDLNLYGDTKYNEALAAANGRVMNVDQQAVTGWLTPQYINGLMDKYNVPASKRAAMQTIMEGTRNQIRQTSANIVGSHVHAMETLVAKVISMNSNLSPEQSRGAAQMLRSAFEIQETDPDGAMNRMLQFHAALNNPEVFQRVYDMAQTSWQGIQELDKFLKLRAPYYMSERRPGSYGLIYKDPDGKVRSQYYATANDRNNAIRTKNLSEADLVRQVNPQDRDYGISQSVFGLLDEVHNRVVEKLTPLFGEEEAGKLGQVLDYSNELRNALNARDVLRTTTGRELAPGREELDMFAAHQHYLNATTSAIRNRFIKLESELLFTDPSFANQPFIKDYINNHIQAVLQPDGQVGRAIQQASFFYYLWGNVSSMIMQMSHQLMGLAPMLTARGASVAGSYKTLGDANLAVLKAQKSPWLRALGSTGKYDDPVIGQMVDRAKAEGVITSWIARELDHTQDLSMVNRMRVTQGLPEWKQFDLLKNGLYQGYSMIRRFYDLVPVYNSEVAFVAALKHLSSEAGGSLRGEELYREASFLKDNTMFPGGKENRPGMFQYLPRSAAQSVWSLQTYSNGLITMMGDLIRRSVNPKGAGLTPAQGAQVRKAAAQMLIAQVSIGGVMALPFGQALLFALQKLFPDHDVEGDVRKTLANLAGDDGALGQSLSSIMMNGVPNSFSYGPDIGSRFALAGVFHVSPYSGVGWEQITGPIGGIMGNLFQGAQAGLRGDPMETVESMMPAGFKRIYDTVSQGQKYQTRGGKTLVNDLKPEEIAARLIGFRPARVARIEDLQNLNKVAEAADKSEQAGWTQKQVRMLEDNRDAEVQQNIAQRVEKKRGVYPAKHYADVIAQEYANQNLPVDLRRYGNRATILQQKALRGVLGTQTESPSNMDRLQMQAQIAARLGLGGPTMGGFRRAGALDNLMRMYPHLTNSQANLLLTHAAGSRPPPDLYQELLSGGAAPGQ